MGYAYAVLKNERAELADAPMSQANFRVFLIFSTNCWSQNRIVMQGQVPPASPDWVSLLAACTTIGAAAAVSAAIEGNKLRTFVNSFIA